MRCFEPSSARESFEVVGESLSVKNLELDLAYGLEIYVVPIGINVEKEQCCRFPKDPRFPWPH